MADTLRHETIVREGLAQLSERVALPRACLSRVNEGHQLAGALLNLGGDTAARVRSKEMHR